MKKLSVILVALGLSVGISTTSVYAYQFPNNFWPIDNQFLSAKSSGDLNRIASLGLQEYEILKNEPANDTTYSAIASRLLDVAESYEKLGMYEESKNAFIAYIPYAEYKNWTDGVIIAKAKIKQFESILDLYQPTYENVSFKNAKNEPGRGVIFGLPMDSATQSELTNSSMLLVYSHYGDSIEWWVENTLQKAKETGKSVELAVNLANESSDIWKINNGGQQYFYDLAQIIARYPDVPVYFRFGAEVNVWNNRPDAGEYKAAFRAASNIVRSSAANVATVFSIVPAASWGVNSYDYYPGDDIVDWVGVSLYMQKYFLGRNDWSEKESFNSICFLTGDSADPVIMLRDIIETYGATKPIMIAESGASHYIKTLGENCTDWASSYLKQMLYNVPMVYPQVKLLAYFDASHDSDVSEFSLMNNSALKDIFVDVTKNPYYVQDKCYNTDVSTFKKVSDTIYATNSVTLNAYVHLFRQDAISLNYFINDVWVGGSADIPYTQEFDLTGFENGTHTLKVVASSWGSPKIEKYYNLVIENVSKPKINVVIDSVALNFEQEPVIINDRTMVPLRKIFEVLGATVEWDDITKTVKAKKDNTEVTLSIGGDQMMVNSGNSDEGRLVTLDSCATIVNNFTMVPVRAVSEAFNCRVEWEPSTSTVTIFN